VGRAIGPNTAATGRCPPFLGEARTGRARATSYAPGQARNRVRSYSFDPFAEVFDRTRASDPRALGRALDFLRDKLPPRPSGRILEVGAGTGRIALPLAGRGYRVVGVDLARKMLLHIPEHARGARALRVEPIQADATQLPLRSSSIEWAYWVHVLHLVEGWRQALDELLRVVGREGSLVAMDTGHGREVPALLERYRAIARSRGSLRERLGPTDREILFRYLIDRGCEVRREPRRWRWVAQIPIEEALQDIDHRAFAAVRFTSLSVHREIMRDLREWSSAHLGGPGTIIRVPNEIRMAFVRRPTRDRSGTARSS
jgi:ubiquinone/menaquinone biosynthesis C-methylase UbiE